MLYGSRVERVASAARDRLVVAAGELFYERGIAATGVDAILQRAGVSPATMYAHFRGGKDALITEYLKLKHQQWRRLWDEQLQACTGPDQRPLAVFDALVQYRRNGYLRGCIFLSASVELPPDHPGQQWLSADTTLLEDRLLRLTGELGVADPRLLSQQLLVLYDGALAAGLRRPGEMSTSLAVLLSARAAARDLIEASLS